MKKRLSKDQEFEVLKLVLDKFLWVGFIIMAVGLYKLVYGTILEGIGIMTIGALVLVLFLIIVVKEYEILEM